VVVVFEVGASLLAKFFLETTFLYGGFQNVV